MLLFATTAVTKRRMFCGEGFRKLLHGSLKVPGNTSTFLSRWTGSISNTNQMCVFVIVSLHLFRTNLSSVEHSDFHHSAPSSHSVAARLSSESISSGHRGGADPRWSTGGGSLPCSVVTHVDTSGSSVRTSLSATGDVLSSHASHSSCGWYSARLYIRVSALLKSKASRPHARDLLPSPSLLDHSHTEVWFAFFKKSLEDFREFMPAWQLPKTFAHQLV